MSGNALFIALRLRAVEPTYRLEWSAVDCFHIRAGLATERTSYFDSLLLLRQVARQPHTWLRFLGWARSEWANTGLIARTYGAPREAGRRRTHCSRRGCGQQRPLYG